MFFIFEPGDTAGELVEERRSAAMQACEHKRRRRRHDPGRPQPRFQRTSGLMARLTPRGR